MKHPIFVYGTLKKGEENHFLLSSSDFVCETQTSGKFTLLDLGNYPAVIISPKNYFINGEIYEVDDQILALLDQLEDYPNYYIRRMIMTQAGVLAWMYYFPNYNGEVIMDSGDWSYTKHRGDQNLDFDLPYH